MKLKTCSWYVIGHRSSSSSYKLAGLFDPLKSSSFLPFKSIKNAKKEGGCMTHLLKTSQNVDQLWNILERFVGTYWFIGTYWFKCVSKSRLIWRLSSPKKGQRTIHSNKNGSRWNKVFFSSHIVNKNARYVNKCSAYSNKFDHVTMIHKLL